MIFDPVIASYIGNIGMRFFGASLCTGALVFCAPLVLFGILLTCSCVLLQLLYFSVFFLTSLPKKYGCWTMFQKNMLQEHPQERPTRTSFKGVYCKQITFGDLQKGPRPGSKMWFSDSHVVEEALALYRGGVETVAVQHTYFKTSIVDNSSVVQMAKCHLTPAGQSGSFCWTVQAQR